MASSTLNQPVRPGDLILTYTDEEAFMLLAKTGSDETNPPTSAIMVETPGWSDVAEPGYWTLSGPEVYYTKENDENEDNDDQSGSEKTMIKDTPQSGVVPLDQRLERLRKGEEREVSIIVNPHGRYVVRNDSLLLSNQISNYSHGRDVLHKYFFGTCPHCGGASYVCPGCDCICREQSELYSGCGVYLSCPMCLGLDFAFYDNGYMVDLLSLQHDLFRNKNLRPDEEPLGVEVASQMKIEGEAVVRERYELCNRMLREMGLKEYDVEQEVKDWQETFC
jgi:hypothetical protein